MFTRDLIGSKQSSPKIGRDPNGPSLLHVQIRTRFWPVPERSEAVKNLKIEKVFWRTRFSRLRKLGKIAVTSENRDTGGSDFHHGRHVIYIGYA